jgi:hypothetical protein
LLAFILTCIRPGLAKKYQIFWFFQITDASAFKPSLGKLLDDKVITSSADALGHRKEIYEVKTSQPGILHELAAVNIAFSFKGMQKVSNYNGVYGCKPALNLRFCCSWPRRRTASWMTHFAREWKLIW